MLVLLVHGLGRTPLSLSGLAAALRRGGHHTRFFGYSPTFESITRIVRRLTTRLHALAALGNPVGIVGHSLGGLLLRLALPQVPALRVHHFVMLGTPHQPPRLARLAWRWRAFRVFAGDAGRFLTSADAFDQLPAVTVPCTAIAGTAGPRGRYSPFGAEPNDGVVAVDETRLSGAEAVSFPVIHSLMMDAGAVRERVLAIMNGSQ
jgi:pimeloyl-ACP methyl ester carboxylesterase